ncbi:DPP IV N-terminal domain-containing protein [Chondromyces apiculatus]|uniref:WD40 repeat protein n=1 Tax=Chondromyces apiculatus DSM 436 TaxID=1192034 RepID=A0A017TCM8_9BACT|nr:DPP IV N-terminal domain-containing protein [Chondromyces apiculatus]EYF06672.1 WD40 repeat protein [Chondromyces apiculatus DSM 436]
MLPALPALPALPLLLALLLLLAPRQAQAANDPQLDWWTYETTHFRVHHPRDLALVAERLATLAEAIYPRVSGALGHAPPRVELVLIDNTDDANGYARAVPYNQITLFVTAPDDLSTLGDYDDWFLGLQTHEFTHVAHIDNISGIPAIINAILGKTYSPNQIQPRWIIEGLAVVHESRHASGGRMRSTLFDMYLRADVLDDRLAGLDQMSNSPFRWPQGNLWYLYGSRFLGWISDVYGPDTMRAVSADYGAALLPWGINRAIRRATGRTYVELYDGWKDHLKHLYGEQIAEVQRRGLREGTRLTHHGMTVSYPRFVPPGARTGSGDELLYFRADGDARGGVYRLPLAGPLLAAPPGGRAPVEELVARTNGSTSVTFTPEGDLVFASTIPWKTFYARNDLLRLPRGETAPTGFESRRHRLTEGLRAAYPDVSPDGRQIAFCVNSRGTRYLEIARIDAQGELRDRRTLVPSARFDQAYTPTFSPDGKLLAYSAWSHGGYRDIRLVEVATGKVRALTHDRALDMTPVWSPDGRTLYFVSDRTGISNVYAYTLDSGALRQVTNVRTGAFQPAVSPDGKTLVYVGYTSAGHDLYRMALDPARYLPALPAPDDRPDPPPEVPPVPMVRKPYNPLPTIAPRAFSLSFSPGRYGSNAIRIDAVGFDAVGNHTIEASVVAEPAAPAPDLQLAYTYGRLPVDMSVRFNQTVSPRGDYRINDQQNPYDELGHSITAGLSYPLRSEFLSQNLSLSFTTATLSADLPVGDRLDPYATRTVLPDRSQINVLRLGYSFSTAEGGYRSAGATRGIAFSAALDYVGPAIATPYETYAFSTGLTGYLTMPWPGNHTLALRVAGAVSGGTYPRGSTYVVGGYDPDQLSPDNLLTGIFNNTFTLRGYEAQAFAGRAYYTQTIEYRAPILQPDIGLSTLPLYLRRIDGALFLDYGGAFDRFHFNELRLFHDGALLYSPQLNTALGGELWMSLNLGYAISSQLRLGYAYGFSEGAVENGQIYFVSTNSF